MAVDAVRVAKVDRVNEKIAEVRRLEVREHRFAVVDVELEGILPELQPSLVPALFLDPNRAVMQLEAGRGATDREAKLVPLPKAFRQRDLERMGAVSDSRFLEIR